MTKLGASMNPGDVAIVLGGDRHPRLFGRPPEKSSKDYDNRVYMAVALVYLSLLTPMDGTEEGEKLGELLTLADQNIKDFIVELSEIIENRKTVLEEVDEIFNQVINEGD